MIVGLLVLFFWWMHNRAAMIRMGLIDGRKIGKVRL